MDDTKTGMSNQYESEVISMNGNILYLAATKLLNIVEVMFKAYLDIQNFFNHKNILLF